MRKPSVAPEGVPVKIHSEVAWGIASHWSWALASSTRTLAGQIDEALAAERDALQATNAELLEALRKLSFEVAGLSAFESEVRQAIGNTNYHVIAEFNERAKTSVAKAEGKL